jgi:nitroreductase
MTLDELLQARYSCRGFKPDPVPRATIEAILATAQQSASWCNTQPWRVIITEGEETEAVRQGLQEAVSTGNMGADLPFPEAYLGDAKDRRRQCAWQLYEAVGIEWGDREASGAQTFKNFQLFGAPHLAVVTTEKSLGLYGAVDCGLWINAFLLAATSHGVATIAQAAIAGCAPYLRERYDIADDRQVLCGISFGYEDPDHPANTFRTERAAVADVATFV